VTAQRDEQWLRGASLEEIREAFEAGEMAELLRPHPVPQLGAADLKHMSPEEIVAAGSAGRLDGALGAPPAPPATGQLAAHHLARMSPEAIVAAQEAGRLDALLGRRPA
jgi:hypothetical protein